MSRYARMIDGVLTSEGVLPPELTDAPSEEREAAGYFAIVADPPKPPDTATTTHNRTFDIPSRSIVWVERDKTADELTAEREIQIDAAIREQVINHLTDLRKIAESSGSLSSAQLAGAVRVLARGQIRLIRLATGLLDATD